MTDYACPTHATPFNHQHGANTMGMIIVRALLALGACLLSLHACAELANLILPEIRRVQPALDFGAVMFAVCWVWCLGILATIFHIW